MQAQKKRIRLRSNPLYLLIGVTMTFEVMGLTRMFFLTNSSFLFL